MGAAAGDESQAEGDHGAGAGDELAGARDQGIVPGQPEEDVSVRATVALGLIFGAAARQRELVRTQASATAHRAAPRRNGGNGTGVHCRPEYPRS